MRVYESIEYKTWRYVFMNVYSYILFNVFFRNVITQNPPFFVCMETSTPTKFHSMEF